MALITRFEERPIGGGGLHGAVLCGYRSFDLDGTVVLQLETYGSADRDIPGKVSQSIQLDENGARQLKGIIERSFPGI
jgi:hypothetical protein